MGRSILRAVECQSKRITEFSPFNEGVSNHLPLILIDGEKAIFKSLQTERRKKR